MWLQIKSAKVYNRGGSRNQMFAITLAMAAIIIIADAEGHNILKRAIIKKPPASNLGNSTVNIFLAEKQNQFRLKYADTLMNQTFLPFVSKCADVATESATEKLSQTKRLCLAYYDMVNNLNESQINDYKTQESVNKTLFEYDKNTLTKTFCDLFAGEFPTEIEKRPFEQAYNISLAAILQNPVTCTLYCFDKDEVDNPTIIPICKLISGGYRQIKLHKKDAALSVDASNVLKIVSEPINKEADARASVVAVEIKPAAIDQSETSKKNDSATVAIKTQKEQVNVQTDNAKTVVKQADGEKVEIESDKTSSNIAANVAGPVANIAAPSAKTEEKPPKKSTVESEYDPQPETENDQKTNLENKNPEYEGDGGIEDNGIADTIAHAHDDDLINYPGIQQDLKPNNIQSALSPDVNRFREDKDSNFFSYFMFLMFVSVSFYVAYHNKTKILALVIEGRRSRNYSSRNGSRRKHHSAEYRKLDSNLEEAIQSGGGKVHTTQIIY